MTGPITSNTSNNIQRTSSEKASEKKVNSGNYAGLYLECAKVEKRTVKSRQSSAATPTYGGLQRDIRRVKPNVSEPVAPAVVPKRSAPARPAQSASTTPLHYGGVQRDISRGTAKPVTPRAPCNRLNQTANPKTVRKSFGTFAQRQAAKQEALGQQQMNLLNHGKRLSEDPGAVTALLAKGAKDINTAKLNFLKAELKAQG